MLLLERPNGERVKISHDEANGFKRLLDRCLAPRWHIEAFWLTFKVVGFVALIPFLVALTPFYAALLIYRHFVPSKWPGL